MSKQRLWNSGKDKPLAVHLYFGSNFKSFCNDTYCSSMIRKVKVQMGCWIYQARDKCYSATCNCYMSYLGCIYYTHITIYIRFFYTVSDHRAVTFSSRIELAG